MTPPSQTGSFWICPDCRKHVPSRVAECRCGYRRGSKSEPEPAVNLGRGAVPGDEEKPGYLRRIGITAGIVGLIAAAIYISLEAQHRPAPKDTELARRLRERRSGNRQPEGVYVPMPVSDQRSPAAASTPSVGASLSPESPDAAHPVPELPPAGLAARVVPPTVTPTPEPTPYETETDIRRREGLIEFERAMIALSTKADQADIAWHRYLTGCRENITTVSASSAAVAGAASRDWIAVVGAATTSSVTVRTWTESCAEAGAFFSLASQVSRGMCVAEDAARRASLYPGSRRELRIKYRLDWSGWDSYCR